MVTIICISDIFWIWKANSTWSTCMYIKLSFSDDCYHEETE